MKKTLRTTFVAAAVAALAWASLAQTPATAPSSRPPGAAASAPAPAMPMSGAGMARMDEQMKSMRAMHDKMAAAKTPEARQALIAEHMKLMQDVMAAMSGMGPMHGDTAMRQQMMEKRMDMMQSMMQMMVDRMQALPPPAK